MLRETKKGNNMEGLVFALFVLKNSYKRPATDIPEPEFQPFNLSALRLPKEDDKSRGTKQTRQAAFAVSAA
jgi:hypothetical protein